MAERLHVAIAGAGIGGLCLAQGLRKEGICVSVYEREASVRSRGQGYRFRIDSQGDSALRRCLPSRFYDLYRATANRPSKPPAAAFNHRLELIYRMPNTPGAAPLSDHLAVNRLTLRQVLLGGLTDCVYFSHEAAYVEPYGTDIRVSFSNGQSAVAHVLVAADGIHSSVRRQLLPQAEIADLGMQCIYGKTPLNEEILSWLPEPLFSGFTPVLGPHRRTLALGIYRSRQPFREALAEVGLDVKLDPVPDYLMWMLVFPAESLPATGSDSSRLHQSTLQMTEDWHPDVRRILQLAEVSSTFSVAIRSARHPEPWRVSNITFIGDAIHAMTPAGGVGANTALRDAALLTDLLAAVSRGELGVDDALAHYESEMRHYAFAAVQQSLQAAAHLYQIPASNLEGVPC
ncbi:MAG TPA: NAD(P)/FAD-dependent oxidoreductase [Bryobacteraceae bacterium]|jgi:2-polyprenyl-6-methoxyphenol hydroxylase-like FAD-dependent oxidoreductase